MKFLLFLIVATQCGCHALSREIILNAGNATLRAAKSIGTAIVHGGSTVEAAGSTTKDVGNSVLNNTTRIKGTLSDLILSPEALFELTKNAIAGYPLQAAFTAINKVCKCTFITF